MRSAEKLEMPWFESPFFEDELERSDLDPGLKELARKFARDGYVTIDISGPDFDRLAAGIHRALDAEQAQAPGTRIQDEWRRVPEVRELATYPQVIELLQALYRRRPIPFQTLNFRVGTQQRTHSDIVHFNSLPERFMCGVWIALEDVGPECGPLHYYPGSHRLSVYLPHDIGLSGSDTMEETYPHYISFLADLLEGSGLRKETLTPRKGEVLVWAANLLHGGDPITDPSSTRRSQVNHYFFDDCRWWTPVRSDPPLGQYFWRRIVNLSTGEVEPHRYHGREVSLPLHTRARNWAAFQSYGDTPVGRVAERLRGWRR